MDSGNGLLIKRLEGTYMSSSDLKDEYIALIIVAVVFGSDSDIESLLTSGRVVEVPKSRNLRTN